MEKQQQFRRTKRIEVRFGVERASYLGFTVDVSATGLFLKTSTVFPPQTDLVLELTLPDQGILSLRGTVMWSKRVPPQLARHVKKAGMGIELIEPSAAYREFVALLAVVPVPSAVD
ncbi:MAG: PilZ domain-containing protein [Nitrospiria bacterium]